jgi:hypothetical protein
MDDQSGHPAIDAALATPPVFILFTHYFNIVPLQSWVYILTIVYTFLAIVRITLTLVRSIFKGKE